MSIINRSHYRVYVYLFFSMVHLLSAAEASQLIDIVLKPVESFSVEADKNFYMHCLYSHLEHCSLADIQADTLSDMLEAQYNALNYASADALYALHIYVNNTLIGYCSIVVRDEYAELHNIAYVPLWSTPSIVKKCLRLITSLPIRGFIVTIHRECRLYKELIDRLGFMILNDDIDASWQRYHIEKVRCGTCESDEDFMNSNDKDDALYRAKMYKVFHYKKLKIQF